MKVEVKNLSNEVVRQLELPDEVFGYPYKEHLIHVVVEATAPACGHHPQGEEPGEVSGTNKKPFKQKGTGRARAGEARSPLWRKGGTVHGPVPRSYEKRITVQEKKSALKSALSRKLHDEGLVVVDSFELDGPKTKALAARLAGLGIVGKALLVDDSRQPQPGARRPQQPAAEGGRRPRRQRLRRRRPWPPGGLGASAGPVGGGAHAMRLEQVIRRPLLSEKVMEQKETQNIVAFEVDGRANKIEVKKAVEAQFKDVKVEDVRILRGHGKVRRQGKFVGRRSDWKKAYVRLEEGSKIEFFEGV